MATETLHLTDEQAEVIRQMVANGSYGDASHVVDEALRLLVARQDDEEAELDVLRAELQRGFDDIEAGRYIELNSREDIDALGQRVIRRGLERLAALKNVAFIQ
ncbi:MAG: type II toxin-antitoxin system ParD family antitoxin [Candidatus Hydrogenedentes bacterium]|nr:type II toxin-antitoxin system ParD family antitoxin [Candidatus Hydrogenedentota bacterium]